MPLPETVDMIGRIILPESKGNGVCVLQIL